MGLLQQSLTCSIPVPTKRDLIRSIDQMYPEIVGVVNETGLGVGIRKLWSQLRQVYQQGDYFLKTKKAIRTGRASLLVELGST
jgi:hypothetical protein